MSTRFHSIEDMNPNESTIKLKHKSISMSIKVAEFAQNYFWFIIIYYSSWNFIVIINFLNK